MICSVYILGRVVASGGPARASDSCDHQDLDLSSVWGRLRDLQLLRVEVFTMTRSDFDEWKHSLGTLAEIVASTGIVVYSD